MTAVQPGMDDAVEAAAKAIQWLSRDTDTDQLMRAALNAAHPIIAAAVRADERAKTAGEIEAARAEGRAEFAREQLALAESIRTQRRADR